MQNTDTIKKYLRLLSGFLYHSLGRQPSLLKITTLIFCLDGSWMAGGEKARKHTAMEETADKTLNQKSVDASFGSVLPLPEYVNLGSHLPILNFFSLYNMETSLCCHTSELLRVW